MDVIRGMRHYAGNYNILVHQASLPISVIQV